MSFAGFLDAAYLAIEHYLGAVPPCSILKGCEIVTTSIYATLEGTVAGLTGASAHFFIPGGISVALIGAVYYLFFFLAAFAAFSGRERFFRTVAPFTAAGFTAAGWFLYVQARILNTFCVYCVASATTSTLLFLVALALIYWKDEISQIID